MDHIAHYQEIIKNAITNSFYYRYSPENIETLFLADDDKSLYMLYAIGWSGKKHTSSIILLVRVKDDKIWIDEDWTEEGIATDLLKAGVPKEKIVLAFHHPSLREYTEFAAA